jgi:hypothetical protein
MASNLLQPYGLQVDRNRISGAATYQATQQTIKQGYGSNIGKGDPVKFGTGTNQGCIVLAGPTDTNILGIFQGVLPYYDATLQGTAHGLNGAYQSTANPNGNISCLVYDDPFMTFIAQVNGGPFLQSWVGQNINMAAYTAPNISGISTVALDGTTVGLSNTLMFQIVGVYGVSGTPQDPANTNPWLEVRMNTAQILSATGV